MIQECPYGCCDNAPKPESLVAQNKRLRDALNVIRERSGMRMDYGSDSDAIQAIYIASVDALKEAV